MENDDDTMAFLRQREERLGADITYRTYALFYGSSSGERRDYGVFLYTDGQTFIFEDFERPTRILGIEIRTKRRQPYVKLEHSFKCSDVASTAIVSRSSALDVIGSKRKTARPLGRLGRVFRKTVLELGLKDGTRYYFELMDPKGFQRLISGES